MKFTQLNRNTKKAQQYIKNYLRALRNTNNTTIYDIYQRPSSDKIEAYKDCEYWARYYKGKNIRYYSYNSFTFVCGFIYNNDFARYLVVITHKNNYRIKLKLEDL